MGLRAKFNLAVLAAFAIGLAIAAALLQRVFVANARQQVLENARIMMRAADAVQHYTNAHITPIIDSSANGRFVAASVPFFAAQATFKDLQRSFPDYSYRNPALNPTNPTDRPTDWEADFINSFRNDKARRELVGERATPTGRSLTLARPIAVDNADCLTCHSTPARAPAALVATYGEANGFGWKLHEVVGAEVVTVPMALPMAQARMAFLSFLAVMGGMFVLVLAILNILLHYMVIRPVRRVTRIANAVSLGDSDVEEYEKPGHDEISVLSVAFNRMRRSLDTAMRMLER